MTIASWKWSPAMIFPPGATKANAILVSFGIGTES